MSQLNCYQAELPFENYSSFFTLPINTSLMQSYVSVRVSCSHYSEKTFSGVLKWSGNSGTWPYPLFVIQLLCPMVYPVYTPLTAHTKYYTVLSEYLLTFTHIYTHFFKEGSYIKWQGSTRATYLSWKVLCFTRCKKIKKNSILLVSVSNHWAS